jgi:hypothetical protein
VGQWRSGGKHEGTFEHLAYARMMVSIVQRSGEGGNGTVSTCYPSARNWNFLVRLTRVHEEIFMADIFETYPVSVANIDAGLSQIQRQTRVLLKLDQNGHVRSLDLELEPAWLRKPLRVGWMNGMPLRRA